MATSKIDREEAFEIVLQVREIGNNKCNPIPCINQSITLIFPGMNYQPYLHVGFVRQPLHLLASVEILYPNLF